MKKILVLMITASMLFHLFTSTAYAKSSVTELEAPTNLTAELKYREEDGSPYFELRLTIPESMKTLSANIFEDPNYYDGFYCDNIEISFDFKYADYDWNKGPTEYIHTSDNMVEFIDRGGYWEYEPFDKGTFEKTDIEAEVYDFRARFITSWAIVDENGESGWMDNYSYSAYSNMVTIGNEKFYDDASSWAVDELNRAKDAGLIPAVLIGADLTKQINREEFCELAVLLYEKSTSTTSTPVYPNPFTDTSNQQILKAYKLGITAGTSTTTFTPKKLINRQECAAMLFRAIKAISPNGEYSADGVPDFPDQKYIDSWAVDATKYMSKVGIIKGDSLGNYMPRATTTVQEAAGYGMATREAAILMAIRTFENIK